MDSFVTGADGIARSNEKAEAALRESYEALGASLARRGIDIDAMKRKAAEFAVAVPSWGTGTGGTRFARFPGTGEPRDIFHKLDDCAAINQFTRATPRVALHIPWDKPQDPAALKSYAEERGLGFDAMNSNTFSDAATQQHTYKFGSLSHTDPAVRRQAVEHNLECIEIGKAVGSKAISIWIGDGSNFPGQSHFTRAFERYIDSCKAIYAELPDDWRLFTEHKMYEPAFYSTVIQDWGSSYLAATELGPKAFCLVDLGHHAPNTNIEMIVARLIQFKKLGGFHFNDSKYGDDDLDAGSINPYQLFLVFNELVDAEARVPDFHPAHMIDQSHNVTDPIESLMVSATEIERAYLQALLIDRAALEGYQDENDALMASETLKAAYRTDVEPILATARLEKGGAIHPVAAYRSSGYRAKVASDRPLSGAGGGGLVG
ncbi:L-rhamnose isomerase / sugar isomerase [Faunimonas pinastri]|uniref:L-rhamnose isomerase / sugar isomerase n=1 Tax=Faunimonas pinastri TaxID=1855383 RepID=A0A1H9NUG9_9HYPH|nr:L-rhamnose catabolism isomerase [Faunimonas pinastri]SER39249.1 L-rhamnose isomerase / sugar isomerase [Faunimonas pinastri]